MTAIAARAAAGDPTGTPAMVVWPQTPTSRADAARRLPRHGAARPAPAAGPGDRPDPGVRQRARRGRARARPAARLRPRRHRRVRGPLGGPGRLRPQPAGPAQRHRRPRRLQLAAGTADPGHLLRGGRRRGAARHGRRGHPGRYTDQGIAAVEIFLAPKRGYGIAPRRRRDRRRHRARRRRYLRHPGHQSRCSPPPASAPWWSGRAPGSWSWPPATSWSTSAGPASPARSLTSTRTR